MVLQNFSPFEKKLPTIKALAKKNEPEVYGKEAVLQMYILCC